MLDTPRFLPATIRPSISRGTKLRSGTIARSVSVLQLRCFVCTSVHVSRGSSFLKDALRRMEVDVELEAEDAVGRHRRGPALIAVGVANVLLAEHVEAIGPQAFANVRLRRQAVGRAELVGELQIAERDDRLAGGGFQIALGDGRLQVIEQPERVELRVVEDDLPLARRHLREVLLRRAGFDLLPARRRRAADSDSSGSLAAAN